MSSAAPSKQLAVLDLDNTMIDTLTVWEAGLRPLIDAFSRHYKVDVGIVHELIREAPGQFRFNDGVSLQDWMIDSDPRLREAHESLTSGWAAAGNPIKRDWLRHTAEASVFYEGVLPMLRRWKEIRTGVVIQTDAEDSAVIRRLWLMGKNAAAQGLLESPHEILDLVGRIYCQPGMTHSAQYMDGVDLRFTNEMNQKMHRWTDRLFKPAPSHLRRILEDARVKPENAVYVGDTHKDGVEAKSFSARMAFAWASYGAHASSQVLSLYSAVGSKSYMYGHAAIAAELSNRGVVPDATLHHSFHELEQNFDWVPN